MTNPDEKPLINLLVGWPHESLFPLELLRATNKAVFEHPQQAYDALQYSPSYYGYMPLRQALADWLINFYTPPEKIETDRIAITGGASQNLTSLLSVFSDPIYTRNIWIVVPTYMLAFRTFADHGFHDKMRAVPEGSGGVDIDYLEAELQKADVEESDISNHMKPLKPDRPWTKLYRHIIYCVPTFSNPSSKTMTVDDRRALVFLARKHDALIISDDVYDFLQWSADPEETNCQQTSTVPRLVDVDRFLDGGPARTGADGYGNTASNGSFSKIFAPGIRCGWVEGSPRLVKAVSLVGTTWSSSSPSQTNSVILSHAIASSELQSHVQNTLQPSYARRYHIMLAAVNRHLVPLGVTLPQTNKKVVGGYFFWLTLPQGLQADKVTEHAKERENLIIAPGTAFQVPEDNSEFNKLHRNVRLCWAHADEKDLEIGVERLGRVISAMLKK
ncbi:PLP-dependent transferase [Tothia fuscella]|uniref:PLP-dependent transferase n=1 Tax=Tothia fuscella TaxID=1048955 RepID=A0A9P4NH46_9PEZI|nr:PLP-dependent transferase [Tothia fuscella]